MIDDFTPIIHRLEGRSIKLYPIADVHLGAKECDLANFRKFLEKIRLSEDSYIVLVGDLINNATRNSVSSIYEETLSPSAQCDLAVELLEPVKDRILGVVSGNHELRSVKDTDLDPTRFICERLGIGDLFRQNFAFLRISLEKGNISDSYAIYMTHGKSATKQKKFAQSAIEGVDAIITGHVHDGNISKHSRISINQKNAIKVKSIVSITAASWLNYGGYAARGQFLPTVNASEGPQALLLEWTGTNKRYGKIQVVW